MLNLCLWKCYYQYWKENWFMQIGIFYSYSSLTTYTGTGILEKVSIEYPSIVGQKRQLPRTLFD